MIDFFFINNILIIIVISLGIWLGFFVYFSNKKAKINQLFLLMMLFALLWIILCYFSGILKDNLNFSLLLARLAYGTVALFCIPFFYFFSFFTQRKSIKIFNFLIPAISILIFFLSVFTDFIAVEMTPVRIMEIDIGVIPIIGDGKFLYFGFIFLISTLVIIKILKKYFTASQNEKLKLQYFLLGILIFVITNLIFNVILTFNTGDARYYQIGNYSIIFLLGFTAYAIIKKDLFGIKVVLTTLLVGLIGILLFLDLLLFTDIFWIKALKSFILILFLGFGYALVKSVQLEIKRRQELENLTLQLETTNVKLSSAYKKLETLDKAKSEFISIASHQLRTPLTAIKGYISMIIEKAYGRPTQKMVKPLESIYTSNERLIKLVNDLLSVSRIEAGKIEFNFEKANIEEIIESVINELKNTVEKKGIYLKFEKEKKDLPKVTVDKDKIRQVIMNIIDNAIKYTSSGGITVRTAESQNSKVEIIISDTGEGMTQEEISRLFQSFSRGEAGTRFWTAGAGLGLYIARQFVEMHKGRIWAESKGKEKGSTFYIELPI